MRRSCYVCAEVLILSLCKLILLIGWPCYILGLREPTRQVAGTKSATQYCIFENFLWVYRLTLTRASMVDTHEWYINAL